MPRHPRMVVLDYPHHIVQRGHDRKPVFTAEADYHFFLRNLNEQKRERCIEVLAYCLMTNHVHLILRPRRHEKSLSELMRVVSARHTRRINKLKARSGTLWDGRFKCSVIDTDSYLLACCRYVDLNPVRARIVADPTDYAWSSYRALANLAPSTCVDREFTRRLLDANPDRAAMRYRAFVSKGISEGELTLIRSAVQRNQLTGSSHFVDVLEAKIGRRIEHRRPGNPGKPDK